MLSIDKYGIQVPLTVYREDQNYYLIDGERRWRCALKLNLPQVPAIVQGKPSELENLILMYNIHALREQWDYFTIASKLKRIIDLFEQQNGQRPNESTLSEITGLTRGAIRRCQLLINLPDQFKQILLDELEKPKAQQKLSEDLFIEMEKALKAVTCRMPQYTPRLDEVRNTLVHKFKAGTIPAVTDFRELSKIATAIDGLGLAKRTAERALDKVFDPRVKFGIRDAYSATVEFEYGERKASRYVASLTEFLNSIVEDDGGRDLDPELLKSLEELYERLKLLLGA